MLRRQPASYHPRQSLWWLALVCALVLAPLLGRMHQVVHAPGLWGQGSAATDAVQLAARAAHWNAHGHGHSALASASSSGSSALATSIDTPHALFASHAGADCKLLDHLLLGGALLGGAVAQVYALPGHAPAVQAAHPVGARRLAPFLARAPPLAGA